MNNNEMNNNEMTTGKPLPVILKFALPMLLGNIFQQFYNLVDTIVVGRFIGEDALAAVGTTGTAIFLMTALINGFCRGTEIVLSQYYGIGKKEDFKKTVIALANIVILMTIVITALGNLLIPAFVKLLRIPIEIQAGSILYMRINFTLIIGVILYNATTAILRSIGDSRTPLIALIVATITNIILDLYFVIVLGFGVAGVAYATIIAQFLSAATCIFVIIRRRKELNLTELDFKPDMLKIILIIRTGIPMTLQSTLITLGSMSVQSLVNTFGTATMAAYAAVIKIDSVTIQVVVSLSTALSVFTGQNIGTRNYDRIRTALYQTLSVILPACFAIAALVLIFKEQLLSLFLDPATAAESIEIGSTYLTIIGIAYLIAGIMNSYLGVIRGSGDVNVSTMAGLFELGARIVFAHILVRHLGITGIWIATPISWAFGCSIAILRYYSGKWQSKAFV
ncbi:MAG: MATE family efflux transporter [Clostridiales bacterium]|nr:MATE family efflux transporter [Clostridiales bacterium]